LTKLPENCCFRADNYQEVVVSEQINEPSMDDCIVSHPASEQDIKLCPALKPDGTLCNRPLCPALKPDGTLCNRPYSAHLSPKKQLPGNLVNCSLDIAIYAIRDYAPNEINIMTELGAHPIQHESNSARVKPQGIFSMSIYLIPI
jgi:hypothetical protein